MEEQTTFVEQKALVIDLIINLLAKLFNRVKLKVISHILSLSFDVMN